MCTIVSHGSFLMILLLMSGNTWSAHQMCTRLFPKLPARISVYVHVTTLQSIRAPFGSSLSWSTTISPQDFASFTSASWFYLVGQMSRTPGAELSFHLNSVILPSQHFLSSLKILHHLSATFPSFLCSKDVKLGASGWGMKKMKLEPSTWAFEVTAYFRFQTGERSFSHRPWSCTAAWRVVVPTHLTEPTYSEVLQWASSCSKSDYRVEALFVPLHVIDAQMGDSLPWFRAVFVFHDLIVFVAKMGPCFPRPS